MKKYIQSLLTLLLMTGILLMGTSCSEEEDQLINGELNQYSREVEDIPAFNGASCLVCIDVSSIGGAVNLDWAVNASKDTNMTQWSVSATEQAMLNEIRNKIDACPEGSKVKLQILYHLDPKMQYQYDNGRIRQTFGWNQYLSVESVLDDLAQAGNDRISKVYLTSCNSHDRTSTVNSAFGISTVTHVVTVDNTILLNCGEIAGAAYPTFLPDEVKVIVWTKEGDRQIAHIPEDEIVAGKKFDIRSNSLVDR